MGLDAKYIYWKIENIFFKKYDLNDVVSELLEFDFYIILIFCEKNDLEYRVEMRFFRFLIKIR